MRYGQRFLRYYPVLFSEKNNLYLEVVWYSHAGFHNFSTYVCTWNKIFSIPFWTFPHKWSRFVWILLHLALITNIINIFKFKLLQFNSSYFSSEMPECLSYSNILSINKFVSKVTDLLKVSTFLSLQKANTIQFFSNMASPYLVRKF